MTTTPQPTPSADVAAARGWSKRLRDDIHVAEIGGRPAPPSTAQCKDLAALLTRLAERCEGLERGSNSKRVGTFYDQQANLARIASDAVLLERAERALAKCLNDPHDCDNDCDCVEGCRPCAAKALRAWSARRVGA